MSASLPLSCGRRSVRAFGASGPLDRLAEVTPEPSFCAHHVYREVVWHPSENDRSVSP